MGAVSMRRLGLGAIGLAWLSLGGCKAKPQNFSTTVEVMQVRLFGGGTGAKLTDLDVKYDQCPGDARQIMRLDAHLVKTSCGYGVPFFDYTGERDTMDRWAESKGPEGLIAYQHDKNVVSMDGMPTGLFADEAKAAE